jgi:hypothetical protein
MPVFGDDSRFFDLLEKQAELAKEAAEQFRGFASAPDRAQAVADSLRQLESEGDKITHEFTRRTDEQFITPYDKEDMHSLTVALDDVIDLIEAAGARIVIYRLTCADSDFAPLADTLRDAVAAMCDAVGNLRNVRKHPEFHSVVTRVHELENATDTEYRNALGKLFNEPNADPILVLKWKDIYDHIEVAADKCEDVAVMLEKVAVKYG